MVCNHQKRPNAWNLNLLKFWWWWGLLPLRKFLCDQTGWFQSISGYCVVVKNMLHRKHYNEWQKGTNCELYSLISSIRCSVAIKSNCNMSLTITSLRLFRSFVVVLPLISTATYSEPLHFLKNLHFLTHQWDSDTKPGSDNSLEIWYNRGIFPTTIHAFGPVP